ncbi:hypothetical protein CFC21_035778 [Triticum aestivum]|uniref:Late embryogenesis abundant protein LEA-2 subgroup domain-containing protein n=3 Tax=Triticum TaxID=4564 RepID=A0A9R0RM01_TRITD|nr:uncharacterized protein LOC119271650 [Triticum dicoccoides]XP_044337110.1 uncharacterized protein LOC123058455 [Triticum aestivum]KAF7023209.1 hypothetical protein CFC21_035778 [Triticum aestivum]VAH62607.1 unnamed protein product [Triticum turgidum subsp. durum]
MASKDHGGGAPREDGSDEDCGCGSWTIALLLYTSFWLVMVYLPPMDSLPGIRELDGSPPSNDDKPTTCSVELAGARGLEPALAPGATSPAFDLVVHVDNGRVYELCHGGGDVVVSYAGVPLARGRTPSFRLPAKTTGRWAVNVTGVGLGIPADLSRLMTAERRWGVAQLEIDMGLAWQSFTCDVLVDGQPGASACRLA